MLEGNCHAWMANYARHLRRGSWQLISPRFYECVTLWKLIVFFTWSWNYQLVLSLVRESASKIQATQKLSKIASLSKAAPVAAQPDVVHKHYLKLSLLNTGIVSRRQFLLNYFGHLIMWCQTETHCHAQARTPSMKRLNCIEGFCFKK